MISTLGTIQSICKYNKSNAPSITPYVFNPLTIAGSVSTTTGFMNIQSSCYGTPTGQYIYVAHYTDGLYYSNNYGASFSLITISGAQGNCCYRVACSRDGSVVFALMGLANGGYNDVWRSTNYGSTWTKISTATNVLFQCLDCEFSGNQCIYGIYGVGIYYWASGTETFSLNNSNCGWVNVSMTKNANLIIASGNSKAGSGTALTYISTGAYANPPVWTLINNNTYDNNFGICQPSLTGNKFFYTSSNYTDGVWLISNKSTSALTSTNMLSSISNTISWTTSCAFDTYSFGFVSGFSGTTQYCYYTMNNGTSWTSITPPISGANYSACYCYLNASSTYIVVLLSYGLYGSSQTNGMYNIYFPV